MEEAERAAAGKLLQPCSAKTRKRGADDDQSDPHRRVYRSDHAVPVPRLRAGEQRVEARVHDRARGPAARAHDAGARSRAADPGDRRRPAMVRPEGHYPSAELLRGGPRRVLAAPVRDFPRDRERGGGLVEHRRLIGLAVILSFVLAPLAGEAQPPRSPRIGVLSNGNPTASNPQQEAFRRGLRELGWIEGQTVTIEYRWAAGDHRRFPILVAELVQLKVDVIVLSGPPAMRAAQK